MSIQKVINDFNIINSKSKVNFNNMIIDNQDTFNIIDENNTIRFNKKEIKNISSQNSFKKSHIEFNYSKNESTKYNNNYLINIKDNTVLLIQK
jgi:hypothetical protein